MEKGRGEISQCAATRCGVVTYEILQAGSVFFDRESWVRTPTFMTPTALHSHTVPPLCLAFYPLTLLHRRILAPVFPLHMLANVDRFRLRK